MHFMNKRPISQEHCYSAEIKDVKSNRQTIEYLDMPNL